MSEQAEEAQRHQRVRCAILLVFVGTGSCPGCHQPKEVFARRRVTPRPTRERCLDCWRAER